ncbi:MAG TPA: bifunctional nuclease family protein [Acidimicrobiales bacterium]|nr:bifunctional nuclease family protein [Acidimicrobiales bacterium]
MTNAEARADDADHEVTTAADAIESFGEEREAIPTPSRFIPVEFVEVELTLPSTHPVLVLEEVDPPHRQLRIPIGIAEGSAIAYAHKRIPTPRPLTHEFVTHVFESLDVVLETVRITNCVGNVYAGEAVFSSPGGMRTIACRPSDGVCLALRQRMPPPIAVAAGVLDEVGYASDQRTV